MSVSAQTNVHVDCADMYNSSFAVSCVVTQVSTSIFDILHMQLLAFGHFHLKALAICFAFTLALT